MVLAAGLHPFTPLQVKADPAESTAVATNGRGETESGRLILGVGVNSESGLVGEITLDEKNAATKSEKPGVRSVRFRVVDQAGKPIVGAKLKLWGVIKETLARFYPPATNTDGEGVATIELPRQTTSFVHAYARADKYVTAGANWANNAEDGVRVPAEFTITLEPGTTMGGTVLDEQGRPIAGVQVVISGGKTLPDGIRFNSADDNLRTDAQGKWMAHRVPKDLDGYSAPQIVLKHTAYASPPAFDLNSQPLDQLRAGTAVIVMHKGTIVEGVVTDPQGKPITGASVAQFGRPFGPCISRAETDEKGRYRLPACEPGECTIVAAANGYVPDSQQVAVATDPRKVDLRLRKGELIRIRVVDKQGRPIQGASVSAVFNNKYPDAMALHFQIACEHRQFQVTNEDGRWSTLWIPGDTLYFLVSNNIKSVHVQVPPGAPERVVVLEAGGYARLGQAAPPSPASAANARVSGKVIDENGKPLAGADVWLPLGFHGVGPAQTLHAKSDDQGRFAVEISAAMLAKMQSWDWTMTAWWAYALGRQVANARAEKPSGASEVVIRLGPSTETSFIVLDPERQPCAGVLVEPDGIKAPACIQGLPDELRARVAARTDAKGRVTLPAVSRETLFNVRITTKEFGVQVQRVLKSEPPATDGGTIHLRPVGKIEGRLIADPPETARNVRLFFSTEDRRAMPTKGDAVYRKEYLDLHPEHRSIPWPTEGKANVKSDKDGRFVVPALAEGDMEVYVNVNENQPLRPRFPEHVRSGSGATTLLEIPLVPTVLVRGSVRENEAAKPLPGALVLISYGVGHQEASAVTDAKGNYTARVLPGRVSFHMTAMPRGYAQVGEPWNGDNDVPNDEVEVPKDAKEFDLPPAEVVPAKDVEGQLVDEHDRPVSNARVLVIAGFRNHIYGDSNSGGKFTWYDVPTTIDLTKAKCDWRASDGVLHKCEVLKSNPLVLRALPEGP